MFETPKRISIYDSYDARSRLCSSLPRPRAGLKTGNHTHDTRLPSQHHKTYISSTIMLDGSCCVVKWVDTCKNQTCRLNGLFFYLENTSLKIPLRERQNRLRIKNIILEGCRINNTPWAKCGAFLRVKICSGSETGYIFRWRRRYVAFFQYSTEPYLYKKSNLTKPTYGGDDPTHMT